MFLLLLVIAGVIPTGAAIAQPVYDNIYRPVRPAWNQLSTPNFRIIYQETETAAAIRSAHILEEQYPVVQSLVGGSLSRMPVILNSINDRSNGYVTTLHFRIEVEIPRYLGKSMNPRDGNWLHSVMPHELVHALHLNVVPRIGISGLIRPFSPDAARTMHLAAPTGMLEGIAVFHDSHLHYGVSGRGNHSYFTRQYQAIFESPSRLTPGQTLRDPFYSFPFDRHYMGGFTFINWLQYEYGMETTAKTVRFVSRWPFLGYGSALRYHTGERPSRIFRRFENDQVEAFRLESRGRTETYESPLQEDFYRVRRPFWISGESVLYFAASYNKRSGIYLHHTQNRESRLFYETLTTQDYVFTPHPDESRFLFARYHLHPYLNGVSRMRIHEVRYSDSPTGTSSDPDRHYHDVQSRSVGPVDRLHAPVYGPDNDIWAIRTHHENNMIVRMADQKTDTLLIPETGHFVEMAFHPVHRDSLVLLANRNGMQGLWFLHKNDLGKYNTSAPDIAFDQASVYDPDWHPDGDRILFTADIGGTMNLYEFHLPEQQLTALSNHRWGLMEGRYSPDGSRIAAVQLRENRFELVILDRDSLPEISGGDIPSTPAFDWAPPSGSGPTIPFAALDNSLTSLPENWSAKPYRTGLRWIRPRVVFPYWENESTLVGNRFGVTMSSGDVLRRNSYMAEASTSNNRFWYDITYQFTGFYPGFRINSYQRPIETTTGLWERQGAGLRIPIPLLFDRNTRTSSLTVTPGIDYQHQRSITTRGEVTGGRILRTAISFSGAYRHRLQQNIRDVQPNTGWIIVAETEADLVSDFAQGGLKALRAGVFRYLTPGLKSNQSLRVGMEFVTQNLALYDITGFYSRGFDEYILAGVNNASRLTTRYTIPLRHIDRGSVIHPFFFDRLYMVLFSDTVIPLDTRDTSELYHRSRSVYGAGVRMQMRIFNFPFEIGVAFAWEPTRDNHTVYTGSF